MKGQSAIEYLTTYGWMLLVIAIIGGAIYTTVEVDASEDHVINTSKVSGFLEEHSGYTDCTVDRLYNESKAEALCTRSVGDYDNSSFETGERFTAILRNGSMVILSD